jgi:DNA-binding beta-propeller fold protein YncE
MILRYFPIQSNIFNFLVIPLLFFSFSGCFTNSVETKKPPTVRTFFGTTEKIGEPFGIAVRNDEIYVSDGESGKILRISKDGNFAVLTDKLDTPSHIAFDKNGDLVVADSGSHTIKKIKPTGEVETIAGVENQAGFQDGEAITALFHAPIGIAVVENKIFVSDTYNDRIRVIENGKVSTFAGETQGFADGVGGLARFDTPCGIALTADGKLLVADSMNRRLRVVEADGKTWTLAGNSTANWVDGGLNEAFLVQPTAVSISPTGKIFFTDGNAIRIIENSIFPIVKTISNDRRGFADGESLAAKFNRPSGLAIDESDNLFVADSENQLVRIFTNEEIGKQLTAEEIEQMRVSPEDFRKLAPPRWSYDPPEKLREIAGTLGEIRGEITDNSDEPVYFHNGLDIVGGYGETARFIRNEKVLRPTAAENFGTLRELLRMPTLGYIHIRLGRDKDDKLFDDRRFIFSKDASGDFNGVRVPRGAKFKAGEAIGTLNPMNHVHLVAGRSGAEMNALDALELPKVSDKIAPIIEDVKLFDENWSPFETDKENSRITINGKTRIVARAFDRMDGNVERRRLGVFKIGYQILKDDKTTIGEPVWTIIFDRLPEPETVRLVYAKGSKSGATGETIFNYIASNEVTSDVAKESFFDAGKLDKGNYILKVLAADFFGNTASKEVLIQIN